MTTLLMVLLVVVASAQAMAQAVRESTWVTDGTVNAIVSSGSTIYVGGAFSKVQPVISGGATLDRTTAVAVKPYAGVSGSVFAVASDGSGGWYIGGDFTRVRGQARRNLAHLTAAGELGEWAPVTDTTVRSLVVAGGIVYIAGDFGSVSSQARSRLAAVDAASGTVLPWNPTPDGAVHVLALSGSLLHVGGAFQHIAAQHVYGLATFDAMSGVLAPVPPPGPPGGVVRALAPDGNLLYVGGLLSYIGPVTGGGASVHSTTGNVALPPLDVAGVVRAVVPDDAGGWFIGGRFTSVRGQPRLNLAHILSDGSLADWSPAPSDTVRCLTRLGDALYLGGNFTTVSGQPRSRLAAVDGLTGAVLPWRADALGSGAIHVSALATDGTRLFAGGRFSLLSGVVCNSLGALDPVSGAVDPSLYWGVNGEVRALTIAAGELFIGGAYSVVVQNSPGLAVLDPVTALPSVGIQPGAVTGSVSNAIPDGAGGWFLAGTFTAVGGQARANLAHVLGDGSLDPWNPAIGPVIALLLSGNTLYVGGSFETADGQPRNGLASYDVISGLVNAWDAQLGSGSIVRAFVLHGSSLHFGGEFSSVGGQSRVALAAVDTSSAALQAWDPSPAVLLGPPVVFAMAAGPAFIYVAGNFEVIGGQPRTAIAALDPVSGAHTLPWPASTVGNGVRYLAYANDTLFVAGTFATLGGQARRYLAAYLASSGVLTSWAPQPDFVVTAMQLTSSGLWVGGRFRIVSAQSHRGVVVFDRGSGAVRAWNPQSNGVVTALAADDGHVLLAGGFGLMGVLRANLASIDISSGAVTPFRPQPDAPVSAVTVSGTTMFFGGEFLSMGGESRARLAAYDLVSGLLPWQHSVNLGSVRALAVQGATLYAGGEFDAATGLATERSTLAAFDVTTATTLPWLAEPFGSVYAIASGGAGPLFVGGNFPSMGGRQRANMASIDVPSGLVTEFRPEVTGTVTTITTRASSVFLGGSITSVSSAPRTDVAAVDASTGSLLSWNAIPSSPSTRGVNVLAIMNDTLLIAGPAYGLAGVSASSGANLGWSVTPGGAVSALAVSGGRVFAGGTFGTMGGAVSRQNLAAFDAVTSMPRALATSWDQEILSLALGGAGLHVGGRFTAVGGQLRQGYVLLDTTSWVPLSPDLQLDGSPASMCVAGGKLFMCGTFVTVLGQQRHYAAAVDARTAALTAWNPDLGSSGNAVGFARGRVFIGGAFQRVQQYSGTRWLAAFDTTSGTLEPWGPILDGTVTALAASDSVIYVGGDFSMINGQARAGLGSVDPVVGVTRLWSPAYAGSVNSIAAANGMVFVGGTQPGQNLCVFRAGTGTRVADMPAVRAVGSGSTAVKSVHLSNGELYAGGTFQLVAGELRGKFAAFADPSYVSPDLVGVALHPRAVARFAVAQCKPNPFRRATLVHFALPQAGRVQMQLLDVSGRVVGTPIESQRLEAGEHDVVVDAAALGPGLYWYRVEWNGQVVTKRMVAMP